MYIALQIVGLIAAFWQEPWPGLPDFTSSFAKAWQELGRQMVQRLIQGRIRQLEAGQSGCRQIRSHRYHTVIGTIEVEYRVYDTQEGSQALARDILSLPEDAWLPDTAKLATALGIGSEFVTANRMFEEVTGVKVCEKTLANLVKREGVTLNEYEAAQEESEIAGPDSALALQVRKEREKPRIYVEADGVMTPLNQGRGYKEARVGVIFWESERLPVSEKRTMIRHCDYIATMASRQVFGQDLYRCFTHIVKEDPCEVIFMGDGARWLWKMADENHPKCVQILDFFHVSQYVWSVARACWPQDPKRQEDWVAPQLNKLKESGWSEVIDGLNELPRRDAEVCKAIRDLKRYLRNNAQRIDYKSYLEKGYMIGSGVIESSNRKVVTQRVKQAGMHWSKQGVDSVIHLRAAYLSHSDRWSNYWNARAV